LNLNIIDNYIHFNNTKKMPSIVCGKVNEETKNIIKTTYDKYYDDSFNFKHTKLLMAKFIDEFGKTKTNPNISLNPDEYSLMKAGSGGLYLTLKKNNISGYLFNINNGKVYIIEYDTEHDVTCNPELPFDITLMMMSNGFHNTTPVLLTSN
jgi:hypothetical protein